MGCYGASGSRDSEELGLGLGWGGRVSERVGGVGCTSKRATSVGGARGWERHSVE